MIRNENKPQTQNVMLNMCHRRKISLLYASPEIRYLETFEDICKHVPQIADIWRRLETFGHIWNHFTPFGDIRGHLNV